MTFTGAGFTCEGDVGHNDVLSMLATNDNNTSSQMPSANNELIYSAEIAHQETSHAQASLQQSPANAPDMDERLNQMVDDLVGADEDDDNLPKTPPGSSFADAAVMNYDDELSHSMDSLNGSIRTGSAVKARPLPLQTVARRSSASLWPASVPRSVTPLQPPSADPWLDGLPGQSSPSLPHPNSARMSPNGAVFRSSGHSRVNSATSIRSVRSGSVQPDNLSSLVPTPQPLPTDGPSFGTRPNTHNNTLGQGGGMHSPLLFGAGGGPWSTLPRKNSSNRTPPNGQGGYGQSGDGQGG